MLCRAWLGVMLRVAGTVCVTYNTRGTVMIIVLLANALLFFWLLTVDLSILEAKWWQGYLPSSLSYKRERPLHRPRNKGSCRFALFGGFFSTNGTDTTRKPQVALA